MTSKQRYLAAIGGQGRDRAPVTPIFMAWAAHYVGRSYRDFYLDGDVLVEAQLAVIRAFGVDQISAISDPWRESSAYGMEFDYPPEGVGRPRGHVLETAEDFEKLGPLDFDAAPRVRQRIESVARMAAEVGETHSVLGWVEGPMAQYADLRGMETAMIDLIDAPEMFARAAEVLVDNGVEFARRQIAAGADTVGVGDAAASLIGPGLYRQHVLPWEKRLFAGIHEAGGLVKLHICGNINEILADAATTGADVIDLDWMVPVGRSREVVGPEVCLCGNFDPAAVLLRGSPEDVADAARKCIADGGDRFILQPGCEVPPDTPEENIRAFCPSQGCLIADALRDLRGAR
ncbi:MAG: uroporphyrinogen decarboxylase family protein [Phycisphaerae bacterium]